MGISKIVARGCLPKHPLFYIFKEYEKGSSVISINNDFPVEFNTDIEFMRTKDSLLKYLRRKTLACGPF